MPQRSEQEVDPTTRLKHVTDWPKSGLSKKTYSAQYGITVNQLTYWQKLERRRGKHKKSAFVRAAVAKERPAPIYLESAQVARLVVRGGSVLEISTAVDPLWAARLIAAVGGQL